MAERRICSWWFGRLLASPIRKLLHDPASIVRPYVREGMTVLEPGPGMGFFTIEIARKVGVGGRVIAVDCQPHMIRGLTRRARRAGLLGRIDARLVPTASMALTGLDRAVDFVFAFAVVHEMLSAVRFFSEAARAMKPGARLLLVEPAGHVSEEAIAAELAAAKDNGLEILDRPLCARGIAALLQKNASDG